MSAVTRPADRCRRLRPRHRAPGPAWTGHAPDLAGLLGGNRGPWHQAPREAAEA